MRNIVTTEWFDQLMAGTVQQPPPPMGSALFVRARQTWLQDASASAFSPGANDFALSIWVKPTSLGTASQEIFSKWEGTGNQREFRFFMSTAGYSFFLSPDGSTSSGPGTSTILPVVGQWQWLLVSCGTNADLAGKNTRLYVNGALANTVPFGTPLFVGSAPFLVGSINHGTANWQDASMARLAYWNYCPTNADVTTFYNGGHSQKFADLTSAEQGHVLFYYNLDDPPGGPRLDSGPSGIPLTDNNGVATDNPPP